ncbi:FAD/NAD(P)-binding protein [Ancylobacter sp. G4_0304]|uniref:FAD/NAD(P)-binding protein n=1 Tax=Ancylobacter sp. G4_0304 TaxID=3114289 RepID=UPI0039C5FD7B
MSARTDIPAARRVVIIGGGFAGAVTALHLIAEATEPLELTIVEPAAALGRGIAYATTEPEHVVNGLAGSFALDRERPERFLRWLEDRVAAGEWTPPAGVAIAASSPPRALYGAYVAQELEGTARRAADRIVLATGLHRRETALGAGLDAHPGYVRDVFAPAAFGDLSRAAHVLILGTGLTMLDALISAERAGFRGHYTVVSRRGLLVEPRRDVPAWPGISGDDRLPATAGEVLAWVRRERRAVREASADWQSLPPLFRARTAAIWAGLDDGERARLLKRLVPFWNLAQHRAAPSSYRWLERVRAQGRLTVLAGTLSRIEADDRSLGDSRLRALIRPRGARELRTVEADRVLSALAYEFDWTRLDDPLVRRLLARGLVTAHPLRLGIAADPSSLGVVGADGTPSRHLFAIGHPLRGALWEASSIREQFDQAQRFARQQFAGRAHPSATPAPRETARLMETTQ